MRWSALLILAVSSAWAAPAVTASPSRVVLGDDAAVTLTVTRAPAALRTAVSSGKLEPLDTEGETRRFRWTPPDFRYPSWAILLFWDARAPKPEVTVVRIPLFGRTVLELDTDPGAEVRAQVAGRSFGPVRANANGRVKVRIEVPPGVRSAEVIATHGGQQTSRTVSLEVPSPTPAAIAFAPIPMGPSGGWLWIETIRDVSPRSLEVRAEGARVASGGVSRRTAEVFTLVPEPDRDEPIQVSLALPGGVETTVEIPVSDRDDAPPPVEVSTSDWRFHALGGAFFGGGANFGAALEVGTGLAMPFVDPRLTVELSLGVRTQGLTVTDPGLGRLQSSVFALPIQASARWRLFQVSDFALDLRAGGSAVPFLHYLNARFQPEHSEGGLGFEAFGGAQGLYRVGRAEVALELRGSWIQLRTPHLLARPGGLTALIGARYFLP